jgi:hypothetical protein
MRCDRLVWDENMVGCATLLLRSTLASLAATGDRPGALWRLDGEGLQANLIRLGRT